MVNLESKHVLSIQSSVSWGYCGNRSATFPLQLLGFDVSTIHTVQFSNHTGYGHWRGQTFTGHDLMNIYQGIKDNGFAKEYRFLLTGYIPGKEGVESMANIVKDLKEINPQFAWLLDPVLGDRGHLYVSPEVIPIYKQLVSMSDLITPNQFESRVVLLSDQKITSFETLLTCIETLHKKYALKHIVITSVQFNDDKENLHIIASSCRSDYTPRIIKITVPFCDYVFVGTGDLFSALILARFGDNMKSLPSDEILAISIPLKNALEIAVSSVQAVIQNTIKSIQETGVNQKNQSKIEITKSNELRIIQSQDELKHPTIKYKAVVLL
ncbi:hypothetical protein PCANB_000174 [Pneumocystis canis]|nr:hypothetical protein PCANB_000174 [Pneumocystis canis]